LGDFKKWGTPPNPYGTLIVVGKAHPTYYILTPSPQGREDLHFLFHKEIGEFPLFLEEGVRG
jgi:hypothetical protein